MPMLRLRLVGMWYPRLAHRVSSDLQQGEKTTLLEELGLALKICVVVDQQRRLKLPSLLFTQSS